MITSSVTPARSNRAIVEDWVDTKMKCYKEGSLSIHRRSRWLLVSILVVHDLGGSNRGVPAISEKQGFSLFFVVSFSTV